MKLNILLTVTVTLAVTMVMSYPDYIPSLACMEMFPLDHDADAQNDRAATTKPPYMITANATSYGPGDVIKVFLNSTKPHDHEYAFYEGAFIQARRSSCSHPLYKLEPLGTFFVEPGETFLTATACNKVKNNAIRHMAHAHVYNSTFYWKAPNNSSGHIYFRGTVARRKTTFWTNVNSEYIRDKSVSSSTPTAYCKPQTKTVGCPTLPTGGVSELVSTKVFTFISFIAVLYFRIR